MSDREQAVRLVEELLRLGFTIEQVRHGIVDQMAARGVADSERRCWAVIAEVASVDWTRDGLRALHAMVASMSNAPAPPPPPPTTAGVEAYLRARGWDVEEVKGRLHWIRGSSASGIITGEDFALGAAVAVEQLAKYYGLTVDVVERQIAAMEGA